MAENRKSAGIKIPDIYLRNDENDATTGQVVISKAGTIVLALSGSDADIALQGSNAQIIMSGDTPSVSLTGAGGKYYIANAGGTVGTLVLGAGNALTFAIQATVGTLIDV